MARKYLISTRYFKYEYCKGKWYICDGNVKRPTSNPDAMIVFSPQQIVNAYKQAEDNPEILSVLNTLFKDIVKVTEVNLKPLDRACELISEIYYRIQNGEDITPLTDEVISTFKELSDSNKS